MKTIIVAAIGMEETVVTLTLSLKNTMEIPLVQLVNVLILLLEIKKKVVCPNTQYTQDIQTTKRSEC